MNSNASTEKLFDYFHKDIPNFRVFRIIKWEIHGKTDDYVEIRIKSTENISGNKYFNVRLEHNKEDSSKLDVYLLSFEGKLNISSLSSDLLNLAKWEGWRA